MKDNIFRSRMGTDSSFKTIDTMGTTPCSSNDEKVRESAHCSAFGAKGHAHAKESDGMKAAIAYDNTLGGENDIPPMGAMAPEKRRTTKKTTAAAKSTAKKPHASTAKKSPAAKSRKNDNDEYVIVEEVIIVEEY